MEGWNLTGAEAGKYFGQIKSEPTSFGGQGGKRKVDLVDNFVLHCSGLYFCITQSVCSIVGLPGQKGVLLYVTHFIKQVTYFFQPNTHSTKLCPEI